VLLTVARAVPDDPTLKGAMALNVSSPSSDVGMMFRYFAVANSSPTGSNWEQWKDDKFEEAMKMLSEATDEATIQKYFAMAHERLVDNPPWLYIVHDLKPRAFSKNVQGFVSPQSWFVDLTLVSLR
jgi:ABC-type transport system substrate-binding protein